MSAPERPAMPENLCGYLSWHRFYPVSQFDVWRARGWWYRIRFWPDGRRRALGVLTAARARL